MNQPASKVKGLGNLFKDKPSLLRSETVKAGEGSQIHDLPLTCLQPGKFQPRRHFGEEALQELADSIQASGVIEPILVRKIQEGQFEIIAGERRWRASQLANKTTIPAIIKELDDNTTAAIALVENIQREDLTPMEVAQGIYNLMTEFQLKQKEVAALVGKKPADISKLLKMLQLPDCLQALYERGTQSLEPLLELSSAYNECPEQTIQFVQDKSAITQAEARKFRSSLKPADKKSFGAETSSPQPTSSANSVTSNTSGGQASRPVKTIAVIHHGKDAVLDLQCADLDTAYCWVLVGDERRRAKVEELILRAVQ